jgi:Ser-tRNA(Ala) deacylase AlaX
MTSEIQEDGTAYNRYDGDEITEELAIAAVSKMLEFIKEGSLISTRDDPEKAGYRYWESRGYIVPCGGTHLKDLKEIGSISAEFSRKKGRSKITFQLKE